jgi:hypothetical protein
MVRSDKLYTALTGAGFSDAEQTEWVKRPSTVKAPVKMSSALQENAVTPAKTAVTQQDDSKTLVEQLPKEQVRTGAENNLLLQSSAIISSAEQGNSTAGMFQG